MLNTASTPGWLRQLACLVYELLLLLALLMLAALMFLLVFGDATEAPKRHFFQVYLWLLSGVYFVWNWTHGGQTLAMQTWRIKLVSANGGLLTREQAVKRFLVASVLPGLSFVWALFDREGHSLHDRLCGGYLMLLAKKSAK
jgi:uncharacterized RDD family membrane protein YckC